MGDRQRVVLATGASRGIGAQTARVLAAGGDHVIVNYREKRKRAMDLVREIAESGASASALAADLADEVAAGRLLIEVARSFGRLDVLVLNASGGLELGAEPDYAMQINRDAQVRLTRLALPLMLPGARIVLVTSHQAHFHGRKPVPAEYEPIARSKRAGTIIVRLLQRRNPAAVADRLAHGVLPTVAEFAAAVAEATTAELRSGDTVYVGGRDYLAPVC